MVDCMIGNGWMGVAGGVYCFNFAPEQFWPAAQSSSDIRFVLRWFSYSLVPQILMALFGIVADLTVMQRKTILAIVGCYHVAIVIDILYKFAMVRCCPTNCMPQRERESVVLIVTTQRPMRIRPSFCGGSHCWAMEWGCSCVSLQWLFQPSQSKLHDPTRRATSTNKSLSV
jgi:hypothetical protein